jgi:enoyl-CoA hydratase/carnithine racemase
MSVEFRVHGAVAFVTLSRPEVLNAIDHAMLDGIERGVREASNEKNIKVLVFAGAGERAFCAGADLALVKALSGEAKRRYIERAYAVLETVAAAPLPTIAALHGFVLGGGLELALACDIRIADAQSTFGLPEVALGSVPSFGAVQRLPRVIGHAKASELMFTARRFNGEEALRIGLINRLTARGESLAVAGEMAREIAANSREGLRYAKVALSTTLAPQMAGAFHGLLSDTMHSSPEYGENIRRFSKSN